MKAQAYCDQEPVIRIFNRGHWIADLPLEEISLEGADKSIKAIGLRRTSAWRETEWGHECLVAFSNRKMKAAKRGD
jgi:hypothetical protein